MCKEMKKAVAIAKGEALQQMYQELNTKEGEDKIYKIAKARQRRRQDKQSTNVIKDKGGKILVEEEAKCSIHRLTLW